jgi:hypothetical protein
MEAICSSEMSVDFQRTTRRYIIEDSTLQLKFTSHTSPAGFTARRMGSPNVLAPDGACQCEPGGMSMPSTSCQSIRPYQYGRTGYVAGRWPPQTGRFVVTLDPRLCLTRCQHQYSRLWRNASVRVAQTGTNVTSFSVDQFCLLSCGVMQSDRGSSTFRKNVLPQFWGSKCKQLRMQSFLPPFSGLNSKQAELTASVFRVEEWRRR